MTKEEAKEITGAYLREHPSVAAKLEALPKEQGQAILGGWLEALQQCDAEDAKSAALRIRLGDDEPIPAYDWEATGAILRRRADAIGRNRRAIPRDRAGTAQLPTRGISQTMRSAMAAVRGMSPQQRRAKLAELFPEDVRDAVKCRDCRDEGMVPIVHHLTLRAVFRGLAERMKRTDWKSYSVPCTCSAGDQWVSQPNKTSEGRQRRYDHQLDCRLPRGGMSVAYDCREQIVDWCGAYDAVKARPNYTSEFEGGLV